MHLALAEYQARHGVELLEKMQYHKKRIVPILLALGSIKSRIASDDSDVGILTESVTILPKSIAKTAG